MAFLIASSGLLAEAGLVTADPEGEAPDAAGAHADDAAVPCRADARLGRAA